MSERPSSACSFILVLECKMQWQNHLSPMFCKPYKIHKKALLPEPLFSTLLKQRIRHMCFSDSFVKYLNTLFSRFSHLRSIASAVIKPNNNRNALKIFEHKFLDTICTKNTNFCYRTKSNS